MLWLPALSIASLGWHLLTCSLTEFHTVLHGLFHTDTLMAAYFPCQLRLLGGGCDHQPQPSVCQWTTSPFRKSANEPKLNRSCLQGQICTCPRTACDVFLTQGFVRPLFHAGRLRSGATGLDFLSVLQGKSLRIGVANCSRLTTRRHC